MMLLLKLVVLLLVFGAAVTLTGVARPTVVAWWNRRIARYVDWFVSEHKLMYESMDATGARRAISAAVLLPAVVGFALGGLAPAIVLGLLGAAGPYAAIRYKRWKRRRKLDDQLVDALILMANGLKAGLTLLQAIELAVEELEPPLVDEFDRLLREIRLGTLIDPALIAMAERLRLPDMEIAVHSIVTLRETGGNLTETFMTVAHTIVERKKVEGKIDAITSQGVFQGVMMCAMPFALGLIFYLLDPDYMKPMFSTPLGWLIWMVVFALDWLGMWLIMKVVRIDV